MSLARPKEQILKKMIKIVFILELEKKLFNETLPSNQKSKHPKDRNTRCTGHKK
jgi:hypothetical protein